MAAKKTQKTLKKHAKNSFKRGILRNGNYRSSLGCRGDHETLEFTLETRLGARLILDFLLDSSNFVKKDAKNPQKTVKKQLATRNTR